MLIHLPDCCKLIGPFRQSWSSGTWQTGVSFTSASTLAGLRRQGKAKRSTAELESVCLESFVRMECFLSLNDVAIWTLQVLVSLINFLNETEG